MPILQLERIEKTYTGAKGGVMALRNVSWNVEAGDFVAIMGPSGCGKSTLLHVIGAMDQVSAGRVILDGSDLSSCTGEQLAEVRRQKVGFVFQFYNLLPTLTVLENVTLPLLLAGAGRRTARTDAQQVIDRVGLASRMDHYPAELSGGEMQRVAIARAVVTHPSILLADEPTGSLDTENGRRIMSLVAELNNELAVTVVLATHDDDVAKFARHRVQMRDGRLLLQSSAAP